MGIYMYIKLMQLFCSNVCFIYFKIIGHLIGWLVIKSAKEGAQTTIHLAVSEDLKGVTGA